MLNDLIFFEKRKDKITPNGLNEFIWEKEISCWACKEKVITTEEYSENSYFVDVETTYRVRKTLNIDDARDYRILHKNHLHIIKDIIPEGEYLKIKCKMVS